MVIGNAPKESSDDLSAFVPDSTSPTPAPLGALVPRIDRLEARAGLAEPAGGEISDQGSVMEWE